MNVVLFGPPGVGKGTQGVLLSDEFGWPRVVTGDILRSARREGTPLGRKAQEFMDAGELVPDALIIDLVREHLTSLPDRSGLIFDGFPRTVPQGEAFLELLGELELSIDAVVVLEADDETLVKRISGRRSSPGGRVYNVYFDPPEVEGRCDETGEPLVHRKDDEPSTVRRRLDVYREETEPLVAFLESRSVRVVRVDGEGSVEGVQSGIRVALGKDAAS